MNVWLPEEVSWLVGNLHLSAIDVYRQFNEEFNSERSYDSIQKKLRQLRSQMLTPESPEGFLNTNINTIDIKTSKEAAKEWLNSLSELIKEVPLPKSNPADSGNSSLVLLLTDLHFGKVSPSFNIKEAEKRILSIPEKLYKQLGTRAVELDEVVVCLGGDIVEGEDIYNHQAHSIDCPVIEQAQVSTSAIWQMIHGLQNRFNIEHVRIETCPGNHGRMSYTANPKTNWDNVVYYQLGLLVSLFCQERGKSANWLSMNVNPDPFVRFKVKDKWGLMTHKGIKHTGTPSMLNKLAGWDQTMPFDFLLHGHWHKWEVGTQFGKAVVKNGSLCGPDDLSVDMGVFDPPRQAYFTVSPGQPLKDFSYLEW